MIAKPWYHHTIISIVLFILTAASALADNYTVLKSFKGWDGSKPYNGLAISGSTLYGTTLLGGSNNNGVVFKLNTDGSGYKVLTNFIAVAVLRNPWCALAIAGSTLYGTANNGGIADNGGVFKINMDGTGYSVLQQFGGTNGANPIAGVTVAGNTLYGNTTSGGKNDYGVLFKINTDGSGYSVLKHFAYSDGASPSGEMLLSGNTLYGVTQTGGYYGKGTLYKINLDGTGFAMIHDFTNEFGFGKYPNGCLVLSGDTLYGTLSGGGVHGGGAVYKIKTDGTGATVLRAFADFDGLSPNAGLTLAGSTLYGTTYFGGAYGRGTVFELSTDGTGFALVRSLSSLDGTNPYAGLIFNGNFLYGENYFYSGDGNVFKADPSQIAPAITGQPQSRTNIIGTTATFQVDAGPPGISYQWRFNGTNLVNGLTISGATSNTLTIANVQLANSGNYTVVVSNGLGSVTNNGNAVLSVFGAPVAGPDSLVLLLGESRSFPQSTFLANDSDPGGLPIAISSVPERSDAGVALTLDDRGVSYYAAYSGSSDHFNYVLTNSVGGAATGSVNITLTGSLPPDGQLLLHTLATGDVRAIYRGTFLSRYVLERTSSLMLPRIWTPQGTNMAQIWGYTWFTNRPAAGANNFYRTRYLPY